MEDTREELKKKREYYRTKMFWILFELVFIFGIPAVLAIFAYKYLVAEGFSIPIALIPVFIAFVLSWIITAYRVRQVSKKLKEIESELKK